MENFIECLQEAVRYFREQWVWISLLGLVLLSHWYNDAISSARLCKPSFARR